MNLRRAVGTGAALILLVASWRGTGAGVVPEPLPSIHAPPPPALPVFQGAGSCSATACHGSMTPVARVLRNEHTTWVTQDRHANAYQVLLSRRSTEMATRLAGGKVTVPAHQDQRCLACHATGGDGPMAVAGARGAGSGQSHSFAVGRDGKVAAECGDVVLQDGVSCESCHGPAQHWLAEHTRYDWSNYSPPDKDQLRKQLGMRQTRELSQRAAICVGCHVGSPGRDMNHDLIAAGHPRLNFEFAAYLANMPPHWVEDIGGNFPARAWAIGQAVTAKAAADLLAHRAGHAAESPWPEFSEYNCFACHHDLAGEQWSQKALPKGSTPGIPAWGTWYYPAALHLARQGGPAELSDPEGPFSAVSAQMNHFGDDRVKAAVAAQKVSAALAKWLQTLPEETRSYDAPKVQALIASVRAKDAPPVFMGWDGAAQHYLALQPLRLALKGLDPTWKDVPLECDLNCLFEMLQFQPGFDSPRRDQTLSLPFDGR